MICKYPLRSLFILVLLLLTACGGGSGDTTAQPTTATLKLSTSGTLAAGTSLAGVGISVVLPAGVTVKTDAGGAVTTGVVTVSGVAAPGSFTPPVYTPASGAVPAKVTFVMASSLPAGFSTGEFVTINCTIAPGSNPKSADFTLTDFDPRDLNGAAVNGLTAGVTAAIQ